MITEPLPFLEALELILNKEPNPQEWDSRAWALREPDVRTRSFFSARVENARFLDRAQTLIFDYLTGSRETVIGPDGVERQALRAGSRADFVRLMREFMVEEGMAAPEDFPAVNQDDLTQIRAEERLRLIFDTNVRQAYGYGHYVQGLEDAVLRRFPAARFIRERDVMEPRERHAAHLGDVRLKTDTAYWADYQNDPEIGGFGVPWGPYGFRSGMGQEDVSREEAIALGLDVDSVSVTSDAPNLTDGMQVDLDSFSPEMRQRLVDELRTPPSNQPRTAEDYAREAVRQVRRSR